MRYHWGLGIGHTYSHGHKYSDVDPTADMGYFEDLEEEEEDSDNRCGISNSDGQTSDSDSGADSDVSDEAQCTDYDSDEYNTLEYEN